MTDRQTIARRKEREAAALKRLAKVAGAYHRANEAADLQRENLHREILNIRRRLPELGLREIAETAGISQPRIVQISAEHRRQKG